MKMRDVRESEAMDVARYRADRAAAEVILARWRRRFPNNAYAWPGAAEDFAIEAVRAIREAAE